MDRTHDSEQDPLFEHYRVIADPKQGPLRVDRFLTARLPHTTRTRLQGAIQEGFVKVNGKPTKASYKVRPHDVITLSLPVPPVDRDITPENIPLSIVYEDDFLMLVDKPAGMVVHPAHRNWTGTLVHALVYYFQHALQLPGDESRPGLVHRIDKDTSGLLVVAKTHEAMAGLARQFFDHSLSRRYQALVWGEPAPAEGTVSVNLGRSLKDRRLTVAIPAGDRGREAITHYRTLKTWRHVSLLECTLETGRTHQIRAHLRHLGHPLFNDAMYGGDKILRGPSFSKYRQFVNNCFALLPRQALHAKTLGFVHPVTGEDMHFDSPLPADMQAVVDKWQRYSAPAPPS